MVTHKHSESCQVMTMSLGPAFLWTAVQSNESKTHSLLQRPNSALAVQKEDV